MSTATFSKRSIKGKQTIDQSLATQSPLRSNKIQQNLFQKIVDQSKIQNYILKQIESAKSIVNNYAQFLQTKSFSKNSQNNRQQKIKNLYEIQQEIQLKNIQINDINKQISNLRGANRQNLRDEIKNLRNTRNYQYYKLFTEINQQRDELILLQKQHKRKKQQLNQSRRLMNQTLQAYSKITNKGLKKLVTYQQYRNKQKQKQKLKQTRTSKQKKGSKKNLPSTKQTLQYEQSRKNIINPIQLKDVQMKRMIAESALKTQKKKHQNQVNELNGKLDFLRQQNQQLDIKIKQKKQQLRLAEIRFNNQTKEIGIGPHQNKRLAKAHRHSQPQI